MGSPSPATLKSRIGDTEVLSRALCIGLLGVGTLSLVPIIFALWPSEWTIPTLRPALFSEVLTPRKVLGLRVSEWWVVFSVATVGQVAIRTLAQPATKSSESLDVLWTLLVCVVMYHLYSYLERSSGAQNGDRDGHARRRLRFRAAETEPLSMARIPGEVE